MDEIAATRGVGQRTVRRVRDAAGIAANPGWSVFVGLGLRLRLRLALGAIWRNDFDQSGGFARLVAVGIWGGEFGAALSDAGDQLIVGEVGQS